MRFAISWRMIVFSCVYFLCAVASQAIQVQQGPAGSRYLVDQNGAPFFWSGDTAWSLIAQLNKADADAYLENRKAKGFNVVLVNLIEHRFSTRAPANIYGDLPFVGTPFKSAPNEAYFAHADYVLQSAAAKGIVVLLDPTYLGINCGSEGWCAEIKAASLADMRAWGQFLGSRYAAYDNILWIMGGDTDPSVVADKFREVVAGIREYDTRHLITAHNWPESFADSAWPNESWLTVNNVYSYSDTLYQNARTLYNRTTIKPFFLLESDYENEHGVTPQQLRAQAYYSVLNGAMGHIFGNCPIWHFGYDAGWCGTVDWKANMNAAGSSSMLQLQNLMRSRAWHTLVPDQTNTIITSGYQSGATYATAARTSDGRTIIAYLPSQRTITVNLTKIAAAEVKAWWFNPDTGAASLIGTYAVTSTPQGFTPDSPGDWVLVLDDAAAGFPTPGVVETTPASAPPTVAEPVSASATTIAGTSVTLAVLGADDGGESSLIYDWSVTGPAGSAPSFTADATNAAKNTTLQFDQAGNYSVVATIRDADGQTATSGVALSVVQGASSLVVSPTSGSVQAGGTLQFTATMRDQFGRDMATQPASNWSVDGLSAGNSISGTGLFTAGTSAQGIYTVAASTSAFLSSVPVTVTAASPPPTTVYVGNSDPASSVANRSNRVSLFKFAAPAAMTIGRIEVYVASGSGGRIRMAVYSDGSGQPKSLLTTSAEIASAAIGWNTAPLAKSLNLAAGQVVWLAYNTSSSSLAFGYASGGTSRWTSQTYKNGFPSNFRSTSGPSGENGAIRAYKN